MGKKGVQSLSLKKKGILLNFNSSYIFIEEVWNTTVQLSKFGFIYIAGVIPLYPDLLDLFDR